MAGCAVVVVAGCAVVVVVVVLLVLLLLLGTVLKVTGCPYLLVTSNMGGVTVRLASLELMRLCVALWLANGRNMGGARTVLGDLVVVVVVELLLLLAIVRAVVVALPSSISDRPSSSTLSRFAGLAVVLDVAQLAWLSRPMCCASAGSSPTAISSLASSSLKSSANRLMLLNVVVIGSG